MGTTSKEIPQHSLERSLAPLWKLTYYGGMLLDWCRPIQRGGLSTVLRCIVIALALTITFYLLVSLTFQLLWVTSDSEKKFKDILSLISRISTQPMILLTWLLFLIRRRGFQNFFQDWAKQEQSTPPWTVDFTGMRRTFLRVNSAYFGFSCCFIYLVVHLTAILDLTSVQDLMIHYFPNLFNFPWFPIVFRVEFYTLGFVCSHFYQCG